MARLSPLRAAAPRPDCSEANTTAVDWPARSVQSGPTSAERALEPRGSTLRDVNLVGRHRERAALAEVVAAAGRGVGGALVLRGQLGVGMTALLRWATERDPDRRVMWASGVESERELPYAGLHRLCAPALSRLDELPAAQRSALGAALGLADAGAPEPLAIGLGLLSLLRIQAHERVLICVIDDADLLDPASATALAFVARRIAELPVAMLVAVHEPGAAPDPFTGIAELAVETLEQDVARELLVSAAPEPLAHTVRDRVLADARGFPVALLELPAQLTAAQRAGLDALPAMLATGGRLRRRMLGPLEGLSAPTRLLLLLAAAEPGVRSGLLWAAAQRLGLSIDAAAAAEERGLLHVGDHVHFAHPLLGLAVYDAASAANRRLVHQAFVEAIDPDLDHARLAWHRAAALLTPDETVAAELESLAGEAKGRGDYPGAAALLEQAAGITPELSLAYGRTLGAVQALVAAGNPSQALNLLDRAHPRPADKVQREQAELLRGSIALTLGQGTDRATMLVRTADGLELLDPRLSRDTYLEALEAAIFAGHFGRETSPVSVAKIVRSVVVPVGPAADDLLLEGVASLVTAGNKAAVQTVRQAIEMLCRGDEPRWLDLAALAALETWDDDALHALANRQGELGRRAEHPSPVSLPLGQLLDLDNLVAGRFQPVATPPAHLHVADDAPIGSRPERPIWPAEVLASAYRGEALETRSLTETYLRQALVHQLGFHVAVARLGIAVLAVGLGEYDEALATARAACEEPTIFVATAALPELVEAAVHVGDRARAFSAVSRLAERARASGTDWALGVLARCLALVGEGEQAEREYRRAIDHLRRSRVIPQLARAHLVFGEWLRRERRPREAREHLRTARDMFVFMGAHAFADRARAELSAAGEHPTVLPAGGQTALLTPQEAQIARLVGDGASNADIAHKLFLSPRTVEYHLHKVFR
ncbi:MAG: Transcriptional regulator, LuxR family, partial [Acidimicrobiaceae bacterium]|nr:Transcriptional regulator, LuxR family [Acidimicrobiaceae bacterium]